MQQWAWCRAVTSFDVLAVLGTAWNLVLISGDRCIFIHRPLKYNMLVTEKRTKTAVSVLWFAVTLWSMFPLYRAVSPDRYIPGNNALCHWGHSLDWQYLLATAFSILVALITVTIMQLSIFVTSQRQALSIRKELLGCSGGTEKMLESRRKRAIRTVVIIVALYFVGYLLFLISSVIAVITGRTEQTLIVISRCLVYTNAMANPSVYAASDKVIRKKVNIWLPKFRQRATQV